MWLFQDKPAWQNPAYDLKEEIAACATHGVGAALSVVGVIVLVTLAVASGEIVHTVGFTIYGISLVILYLASTLYHGVQQPRLKRWLRTLDHAAIYLFIAGTYTPFLLISIPGPTATIFLVVVWGMAIAGVAWKIFFLGKFEILATTFYVLMGWMAVIIFKDIVANVLPSGLVLIVAGGLAYTLGVIFYAWERIPYNHVVWHLFVLAGSASHFFAITTIAP